MTEFASTIRALETLYALGETQLKDIDFLEMGQALGLWWWLKSQGHVVASKRLVDLSSQFTNQTEAIAAILACHQPMREAWLKIIAARIQEEGRMDDVNQMIDSIHNLGDGAEEVDALIPYASLASTPFTKLEIKLFGAPAEQAVAYPKLLRVISATAYLLNHPKSVEPLPKIESENPESNWQKGRILCLPKEDSYDEFIETFATLRGEWVIYQVSNMDRALNCPWIYLLAQVVFTQEAWAAERKAGRMKLELPELLHEEFEAPTQINVVVTTPDGQEVACGTLGELLERVLVRLEVILLRPAWNKDELDKSLAPLIEELLIRKVWKFDKGLGGRRAGYVIGEEFSRDCYRIRGSQVFHRRGEKITTAIRNVCALWAQEKLKIDNKMQLTKVRVR